MVTGQTIAFHSYKGGTGKTTLIANVAALFAKNGFNVGLLDFDLFAPSLVAYFRQQQRNFFLNDVIRGEHQISEVIADLGSELQFKGKFLVGFSSPEKDDIDDVETYRDNREAIGRVIKAMRELSEKYQLDYLFLDTSPGVRYWSINVLAMANLLFLLMKDSDMDVDGTQKMKIHIYDRLRRAGSKYYMILNKVPGAAQQINSPEEKEWISNIERTVGAQVVGSVPCFCDIQFSRHEYLFSIYHPEHPFSQRVIALAETIKTLSQSKNGL